jgi:hypothetical protein
MTHTFVCCEFVLSNTGKVRVKVSLCLTKYNVVKMYPVPNEAPQNSLWYLLKRRLSGLQSHLDVVVKRKRPFPCHKLNPGHPAHSNICK